MYNAWFMEFAPEAYRTTRGQTTKDVAVTIKSTNNLTNVGIDLLRARPSVLPSLRMSTCPPLAVDRLIGLAGVSGNLVRVMEKANRLPLKMPRHEIDRDREKVGKNYRKDGGSRCLCLVGSWG